MVFKNGVKFKIGKFVLKILQEIVKNETSCATRDTSIFAPFFT